MSIVSSEELKRTFCVTKYYGENDHSHRWPQSTTCLVKCEVSQSTDWGWECITGTDKDCDDWIRFNNTLGETKVHAETHMRNYLFNKIVERLDVKYVQIWIYINYSPCDKCAKVIIDMMDEFEEREIEVKINIFFANFYKCHGNTTKNESNRIGLVNMLQKGVSLNVFSEDVWSDLLHNVLKLNLSRTYNHVIQDGKTIAKRKKREIIDKICLDCLHEKSNLQYPYNETDEEERLLREVFEKNDKTNYLADENLIDYETYVGKKGVEYIKFMKEEERNRQLEQEQYEFGKCTKQKQYLEEKKQQLEQEQTVTEAEIRNVTQRLQSLSTLQYNPNIQPQYFHGVYPTQM